MGFVKILYIYMTHWARLKPRITSSHGLFSMGFLGSAGKLPPLFGGRDFKRRHFFYAPCN